MDQHLPDFLLQDRLLCAEPLVRLRVDARHELLVPEHRLDVLGDRRLQKPLYICFVAGRAFHH